MKKVFLILASLLALSACQTAKQSANPLHGAFYENGKLTFHATSPSLDQDIELAIAGRKASDLTLLIYNHGTSNSGIHQKCHPDWMPQYVRNLTRKDPNSIAFYLCSYVTGNGSLGGLTQQTSYKRSMELEGILDTFTANGIAPEQIFLLGHSGGAATSLMTAARTPEKFNSYVVTAPGYGYAHTGKSRNNVHLSRIYETFKREVQKGRSTPGKVYVFTGDPYAPPADMAFMKTMSNVDLTEVENEINPGCGIKEIHAYPWTPCFDRETRKILAFIKGQSAAVSKQAKSPSTASHTDINHPAHGYFFTQDNNWEDRFSLHPTDEAFAEKFTRAFEGRKAEDTVVIVYNHNLLADGKPKKCHPDNLPFYVRNLVQKNTRFVAYSFCAPKTQAALRKDFGGQTNEIRIAELKELLDALADNGVDPNHIFLAGDLYGATTNLIASHELSNRFNSHISAFPVADIVSLKKHLSETEYEALQRELAIYVMTTGKAAGLVYTPTDPQETGLFKNVPDNAPWEFITKKASCQDSQKTDFRNNCFYKKEKFRIMQFIRQKLIAAEQAA